LQQRILYRAKEKIKKLILRSKLYKINYGMNQCYVLPYHMIVKTKNGFYPETDIHEFENQIKHVVRHYKIVTLNEIIGRMRNREPLRRYLAITFDDGFRDNYENAYPILKRYDLPATIFLTTGYVETGKIPWFIRVRYMFKETKRIELKVNLNGQSRVLPLGTQRERYAASQIIMNHLMGCGSKEIMDTVEAISQELEIGNFNEINDLMLSWKQIREMSKNSILFGGHTITHPILSKIPLNNAEEEIKGSKEIIESETGQSVRTFAYPFGKKDHFREEITKILGRHDFIGAVTTEKGRNNPNTNVFEINRSFPWEMQQSKW